MPLLPLIRCDGPYASGFMSAPHQQGLVALMVPIPSGTCQSNHDAFSHPSSGTRPVLACTMESRLVMEYQNHIHHLVQFPV